MRRTTATTATAATIAALCAGFALSAAAFGAAAGWSTSGPSGTRPSSVSAAGDDDRAAWTAAAIVDSSTSAIYRTDDAGTTWTALIEVPRGNSYAQVFADPRVSGRVYAALQRGNGTTDIVRSLDRGDNWNTVLTISIRCVPSFAGGGTTDSLLFTCGSRFFRTADAGLTWQEPATPFGANARLAPAPGGTLYAYTVSSIFKSVNGGTSWTAAGSAPPACPGLLALAVDPSDATAFVAGTGVIGGSGFQCGGVSRSANSGGSWASPSLTGVYVTDLAFDRAGSGRIYAGASSIAGLLPPGGVFLSTDGGRSFATMSLPVSSALQLSVSASGNGLYVATPAGVYTLQSRSRQTRVIPPR